MAGSAIRIAILANASQAKKELNSTASAAERISGKFSRLRAPAVAALGGIAYGAKKAVDAASDLNEESSKSEVIFGRQSGAIKRFASGAATSLGQSKRQAMDAASGFGIIGQKAGLSGVETAKFAKQFTTLSSDLASFNNTSPEEAITAISAAMRGESEPIRRYGVLLDDATLRARALKLGLISSTKQALTPQQKALAASKEILAQTGKAQGDFARTSNGAANKQRILAAQSENLKATVGQGLLPAYQAALQMASRFASVMAANPGAVKAVIVAIAALAAVVLAASAAQKVYTAGLLIFKGVATAIRVATIVWRNAQLALNLAMMLNPVGLVIAAIVALVAIFVIAYKKSETFRNIVNAAWQGIKTAAVAVFTFLKGFIGAVLSAIKTVISTYARIYLAVIRGAWNAIRAVTSAVWNGVKAVVSGVVRFIVVYFRTQFNIAKTVVRTAWTAVRTATVAIWNGIKAAVRTAVSGLLSIVRGIRSKVAGIFSGAAGWLLSAGRNIIRGLISGIESMIGVVKDKLRSLTNLIPKLKGPPKKDARLLRPAGESIIQSLIDGFDAKTPKVQRTLQALSREISTFDASPTASVRLSASEAYASRSSAAPLKIELTLTAGQVSQIQRGRQIKADIKAYESAGGRK